MDDIKVRDRRDRPDSYSVYALARFRAPEVVARLIKQGTLTVSGKPIKVESYAGEREYHIYIKSTHSLTPEQIRKYFSQFGQVPSPNDRRSRATTTTRQTTTTAACYGSSSRRTRRSACKATNT